jgi:hypothetical protein
MNELGLKLNPQIDEPLDLILRLIRFKNAKGRVYATRNFKRLCKVRIS